jgi:hypothetical protein
MEPDLMQNGKRFWSLEHEVAIWLHNYDNPEDAMACADGLAAAHGFRKKATRAEVIRQIALAQHEWRTADPARDTSGWHPVSWLQAVVSY